MGPQDVVLVDIHDLHEDGYAKSSTSNLFVFGALPEERVLVQPFTRRRKKVFARTIHVESASPHRVLPPCSAADICGGCSLQHLDPRRQIELKQQKLLSLFADLQPSEVLPPLLGPVTGYRHKARLGVKYVTRKDKVLVGFREKMSPYVAEIARCEILAPPIGDLLPGLANLVASLSGKSSIPQIEVAVGEDRAALIFRHLEPLTSDEVHCMMLFAREHDIDVYLQPGGPDSVWRPGSEAKEDRLHYRLPTFGLEFAFHPQDFTQVNLAINRLLVERAIDLLVLNKEDRVLDLFCGIGNFSLPLATRAGHVLGIEAAQGAVARANENALRNHITNCAFEVADLFATNDSLGGNFNANKILLDPPRSGAQEACKILASHKVERVVYVSCNPATLVRDARILVESGYRMDKAGVIDMFPHTTHVESIACFTS